MKKYLNTFIILMIPYLLYSQPGFRNDSVELKNYAFQQITGEKYNDPGNRHLNIYFKDYWIPATVVLTSGVQVKDISLKYNGYSNQVVMLTEKFGQIKIDNQSISEFYLFDKTQTYHFKKMNLDVYNLASDIFYQILFQGRTELIVYRKVKVDATNYRDDGEYHIYVPRPIYVLFINNKKIFINQASRKDIYGQFPELKEQIKVKTRKYHKKFKTEDEFISFLKEIEDILIETVH
jgi:hypothetical protein